MRREVPTETGELPSHDFVVTYEPTPKAASIRSPLRRLLDSPPKPPAGGREHFAALRMALAHCVGLRAANELANPKSDRQDAGPLLERTGQEPPLSEQVARIREFYEPLFERRYENPTIRLRDIEQLEQIAAGYKSRSRFITDLTLDPPTSTSDLAGAPYLEEDYLILSTMHSAKGCEWDVVHVIHAADGMIPSDMATENTEGVDEERRLFYVAMTRAKDNLYVYFPIRYYHTGSRMRDAHSYAQLTRFISPDVKALFEQRLPQRVEPRGASDGSAFPRSINTAEDVHRQLGDLFGG